MQYNILRQETDLLDVSTNQQENKESVAESSCKPRKLACAHSSTYEANLLFACLSTFWEMTQPD